MIMGRRLRADDCVQLLVDADAREGPFLILDDGIQVPDEMWRERGRPKKSLGARARARECVRVCTGECLRV
jgi:hypothetical protein